MFLISSSAQVLFYGYPTYYWIVEKCQELKVTGIEILGYIDRNAQEIGKKSNEEHIWTLEKIPFEKEQRAKIAVIILTQNAWKQQEIADQLLEQGFRNLLYVPQKLQTEDEIKLCKQYNAFWEGDFKFLMGEPMIEQNAKYLTRRIPIEAIYTDNKAVMDIGEQQASQQNPYLSLYQYLDNKKSHCEEYRKMAGLSEGELQIKLAERKQLFSMYEDNWVHKEEYFFYAAPHARWNEKGYFNLIDGHHRAIYEIYKGAMEIYLRISKQDYEKWLINVK